MMHIIIFKVSIELKLFVKTVQWYCLHKKKKESCTISVTLSCLRSFYISQKKQKSQYHSLSFDYILFPEGSLFLVKLEKFAICFSWLCSFNGKALFI